MTGIEITLLLIGIIYMIGSFFITEKLSGSDLNKVSEVKNVPTRSSSSWKDKYQKVTNDFSKTIKE